MSEFTPPVQPLDTIISDKYYVCVRATTQDFSKDLVQQVIQRRLDKNVRLGEKQFHIHPPVNIAANIAPTKPHKDDLVTQHASRFPKEHKGDKAAGV